MKWYRDVNTGKVAKYPEHFVALFDGLVEIDPDEAACQDCMVQPEPEAPEEAADDLEEFYDALSADDDEKDED